RLNALRNELCPSCLGVGHDYLEALNGTGLRLGQSVPKSYRARRTGRRDLDKPQLVAYARVMVQVKANLLRIEGNRAIDVGNGNHHQLELPIQLSLPLEFPCLLLVYGAFRGPNVP